MTPRKREYRVVSKLEHGYRLLYVVQRRHEAPFNGYTQWYDVAAFKSIINAQIHLAKTLLKETDR